MIKVHTFISDLGNRIFYVCDFCGEGVGELSNQEDIDIFVTDHTTCDNLENTNLTLLDADLEYIP